MITEKKVFAYTGSELSGLVERIRSGDQKAFSDLYDRFAPLLLGIILKQVGDKAKSEDILQKTFLSIHREICFSGLSAAHILNSLISNARILAGEILKADNYVSASVNSPEPGGNQHNSELLDALVYRGYSFNRLVLESGNTAEELKEKLKAEFKELRNKRTMPNV